MITSKQAYHDKIPIQLRDKDEQRGQCIQKYVINIQFDESKLGV